MAFRMTAALRSAKNRVNYFNTLTMEQKLKQLAVCRFMGKEEFAAGASKLSALRAKMRALRMKSKASSEADAEAERQRQG